MYSGISEQRTPAQAIAECNRNRASLNGWKVSGVLQYDRNGYRLIFQDGRWTLYSNSLAHRAPVYCSSFLIAAVEAAKDIK